MAASIASLKNSQGSPGGACVALPRSAECMAFGGRISQGGDMGGLKRVGTRRDDALARVQWQQLESLLAAYYRRQGFDVEHVGTGGSHQRFDGGVDLRLRRGSEHVLVQAKHWNAYKVPHNDVHQLLGLMVNQNATGAILVTSGEFTRAAIEAASRHGHVQLVDGDDLRAMLGPLPQGPSPGAGKAEALAAYVGERLLDAATDRIRGRARHGGGSTGVVRSVVTGMVVKAVLVIALMAFALLVYQRMVRSALEGLKPPGAALQATQSIPPRSMETSRHAPRPMVSTTHDPRVATDPCHEVIDWRSGTYIDHCAGRQPPRPPTEAEIREQQRKAEEAIKVLEATTPEV